ncbi:hypothetical protein [Bacillus sp. V2I10]|nr:hypothetical protein [Bacillus sp. V2I10]MDQ0860912.1 hypothetical protein [Bacillus sp. V2I10]
MKPNLDKSTIELVKMISLVVIAVSTATIAYQFDDLIDVLSVIGNK